VLFLSGIFSLVQRGTSPLGLGVAHAGHGSLRANRTHPRTASTVLDAAYQASTRNVSCGRRPKPSLGSNGGLDQQTAQLSECPRSETEASSGRMNTRFSSIRTSRAPPRRVTVIPVVSSGNNSFMRRTTKKGGSGCFHAVLADRLGRLGLSERFRQCRRGRLLQEQQLRSGTRCEAYIPGQACRSRAPQQRVSNDTVVFTNGTTAYSVSGSDSVLDISQVWQQSEFNVVGDAGGSRADFNKGPRSP
jgi:hypothetical protein